MTGAHVLVALAVTSERDVYALRRHGRTAGRLLGLADHDVVRTATVLSEAGRDLLGATGLTAQLTLVPGVPPQLTAVFRWEPGSGVPSPELLTAAQRLLDSSRYDAAPSPALTLTQPLPPTVEPLAVLADRVAGELSADTETTAMGEGLREQNRDLLAALQQARAHQEDLQRLNDELEETNQGVLALYTELSRELEETNSGVVALYAELEEKTRALALASEAKTRFWANVSHELRSPVNAVIGLTRLMLTADAGSDPLTADQRRQLSLIASSGTTLLALVDELLDVAKAESGHLDPEPSEVDLGALLHHLRGTLESTARPGVRLVIDTSGAPGRLVTDEVMLTRVLRNALSNGLKYTDDGEVRLTAGRSDGDAGPALAVFTVSDTGIGIPADQQVRVFEEFYQVRGPHQRSGSGTGLGLPYARRLTELLGGRLTLASTPGEGTTVTVAIPADLIAGREAVDGPHPDAVPPLGSLVAVDDDPAFLAVLRPILARLADRVTEVTDSSTAVDTIARLRPDAVLLDLGMPEPDGYAVLRALAAEPELADIPVAVLTSATPESVDRDALRHARGVLGKDRLTAVRVAEVLSHAPAPPHATGTGSPPGTDRPGDPKEQRP
ncbi:ATP-binding protein [Streptomyces sp. NPDC049879]|uniref:ATP-binding response regulator n=1 Tax=Streptomyces sp. NPDC049879 TaxID=3365598 RepID=UPI0037985557